MTELEREELRLRKLEALKGIFNGATLNGGQKFVMGDDYSTNYYGDHRQHKGSKVPSEEVMVGAIQQVISEGKWKGKSSWSVVFRIYQIWGYKGSPTQFVRIASAWPLGLPPEDEVNRDAIRKPLQDGRMLSPLEDWEGEGVQEQFCRLGTALDGILERMETAGKA